VKKLDKNIVLVGLVLAVILLVGQGCVGEAKGAVPGKPACKDGKDNDGDRLIDYPADPGCSSAEDRDEYNAPAAYCGDGSCNGAETCSNCQIDCGTCTNQTNST